MIIYVQLNITSHNVNISGPYKMYAYYIVTNNITSSIIMSNIFIPTTIFVETNLERIKSKTINQNDKY